MDPIHPVGRVPLGAYPLDGVSCLQPHIEIHGSISDKIPIAPPRVDTSKGPNRVNRAHWPTKENRQNISIFLIFPVHGKNGLGWPQIEPGGCFSLLTQTLPTFWAERIWILRVFIFFSIFWTPNFWISRSPDLQISGFPGPQISKIPRFPDFQVPGFPDAAAAGGFLRSQPDPFPNAPGDQIRRKGPCCDVV